MTRMLLWNAGLVALAALIGSATSYARIVSPAYIIASDSRINLVGGTSPSGVADSTQYRARLTVTVLELHHNPIAGIPVVIDFSACAGDVQIAASQSYHAETAGCSTHTIQGYTTTNGTVSFVVIGGVASRGDHAPNCAQIYADSYLGPQLSVGAYDQDGRGGMSLTDVSWFWGDLASGTFHDRSDLDGNGVLSLADVSWAWAALAHPFDRSGASLCP